MGAAACLLGGTLLAVVVGAVIALWLPPGQGPMMFVVYVTQFTVAVTGLKLFYRWRGGGRLHVAGGWADAPMILLGVVLLTAVGVVIEPLLGMFPDKYFEQLTELIGRGGWSIVMTVVAAPILEELFFRGLLLEQLSRRWRPAAAVGVSALFFGLVHVPNPPQMINAFVAAVVMGYIYLQGRSLLTVIVIHAINNGLAYLLMILVGSQGVETRELIGNDTVWWIVYGSSAVVMAASLLVMALNTKKREIALNEEK